MRRVAIIGCGGSGKTTLATELARRLAIPVVHIDSHYWQLVDGRRVESTPEQWTACHRELIAEEAWVIEGMKLGVLDERLERAGTVIYLDLPTAECLSGIAQRRARCRGRMHPQLGVYDRITWEFLRWVWSFRRRQRPMLLDNSRTSADRRSCSATAGTCTDSSTRSARQNIRLSRLEAPPLSPDARRCCVPL